MIEPFTNKKIIAKNGITTNDIQGTVVGQICDVYLNRCFLVTQFINFRTHN